MVYGDSLGVSSPEEPAMFRLLFIGIIALLVIAVGVLAAWVFVLGKPIELPFTLPPAVEQVIRDHVPQALPPLDEAEGGPHVEPPPPPIDPLTLPPENPGYIDVTPALTATILNARGQADFIITLTVTLVLRKPEQAAYATLVMPRIRNALLIEMFAAANRDKAMQADGRLELDYLTRRLRKAAMDLLTREVVWDLLVTTANQRPAEVTLK
jgi:flagellar basal body-associated protein FliL